QRLRLGGAGRPELAGGVDEYGHPAGGRLAVDALQVGRALLALGADPDLPRLPGHPRVGEVDVVGAGGQVLPGAGAERDVGAPGCVKERKVSLRHVVVTGAVRRQGVVAARDVVVAGGVEEERQIAGGDVVAAVGVVVKRGIAGGDVAAAGGVREERQIAGGDVVAPAGEGGHHRVAQPDVVKP